MAAFSTRVWAMALVLAVTMSAFGIGEAEAAAGDVHAHDKAGKDLGESVGFDLSSLSYLMTADNEAKLKALLDNIPDTTKAQGLASIADAGSELQKISQTATVDNLVAAADASAPSRRPRRSGRHQWTSRR